MVFTGVYIDSNGVWKTDTQHSLSHNKKDAWKAMKQRLNEGEQLVLIVPGIVDVWSRARIFEEKE